MDISINTNSNPANQQINNQQAGVAAPQTDGQKADQAAERVVAPKEGAELENDARNLDQKKFDAIKRVAAHFSRGENHILSDIKFTIYNDSQSSSSGGEYVIRFTDVSTGHIDIKDATELLSIAGSGDIVNGSV